MKVTKQTKLTRTVLLDTGEVVKVKLNKRRLYNTGTKRMGVSTEWSLQGRTWHLTRKRTEAMLLARESGMSWDDALKVKQCDWVANDAPGLL